jgi:hypothetical protein
MGKIKARVGERKVGNDGVSQRRREGGPIETTRIGDTAALYDSGWQKMTAGHNTQNQRFR